MKKILFSAFMTFAAFFCKAQSFKNPGEIIYDSLFHRYLIQNYADGSEGFIMQEDTNGTKSYFVKSLTKPVGIEIVDSVLYVVENFCYVKGFHLLSKKLVFQLKLPAGQLCGLTSDKKKFLYTTDLPGNKIFRVNFHDSVYCVMFSSVPSPSDIEFLKDSNQLILCTFNNPSSVYKVSISDSTVKKMFSIPSGLSTCDGIEIDTFGNIFVSSWDNASIVVYTKKDNYQPHVVAPGIQSPIYMLVKQKEKEMLVPSWNENKVYNVRLDFYNILKEDSILLKTVTEKKANELSELFGNNTLLIDSAEHSYNSDEIKSYWTLFFQQFDEVKYVNKIYSSNINALTANSVFKSVTIRPSLWNTANEKPQVIYESGVLECIKNGVKKLYGILICWDSTGSTEEKIIKMAIGVEKKTGFKSLKNNYEMKVYLENSKTLIIDCNRIPEKIVLFDLNGRNIYSEANIMKKTKVAVQLSGNLNLKSFIVQVHFNDGYKSQLFVR